MAVTQRVEKLVDTVSSSCLKGSSSMLKIRHTGRILLGSTIPVVYEIAAGIRQSTARPTSAVLRVLQVGKDLPKTPSRTTCAVDHTLLLQYSALLTSATVLLPAVRRPQNRHRRNISASSPITVYKRNIFF